jgi:tetratricopeptide (TPR) repeat protein
MKNLLRALAAAALLAALSAAAQAQSPETIRPEIGKPLQAAQELMKAGRFKDALAKVKEADAVGNRTPYENFILDRMRGSAAAGAGDDELAARSFEAVLDSDRLQSSERLPILEVLASSSYKAKDYQRAIAWVQRYYKEGGTSEQMSNLLASAHYLSGDYAGVVKDMQARVHAVESAVPVVDETTLRMLAASYAKLGDNAGYLDTLEKLLVHHPKKEYWADALTRVQAAQGFSDRLELDLYRLRMATDTLENADQYVEMAQLSLQAGLPAEAKRVVDAGYAAGKLGSGPEAERHKRLRDMAGKQSAEDIKALGAEVVGRNAESLVATGQALVSEGQVDKGVDMIERGIAKGGLKRSEEARLHLGQAYLKAGQKAKAVETFKAVSGPDGMSDVAKLWAILATHS